MKGIFQQLIDQHNASEEKRHKRKVQDLKKQIEQNEEIQKFSKKLKRKANKQKSQKKRNIGQGIVREKPKKW